VIATDGSRIAIRDAQPVAVGSKSIALPAKVTRVPTDAAEALKPYAAALGGFLGAGSLTLQGAGTKLRKVPGFNAAMMANKLTGVGALERFIRLFPTMFLVEGDGQKKRVRCA